MVLDRCLSGTRHYSLKELMEACNRELRVHMLPEVTSTNTIRQDMRNIESRYYTTIEEKRSGRHFTYHYVKPNFSIYKQTLTEEELKNLNQTLIMLSRFEGLPAFEWIGELNARLQNEFFLSTDEQYVIGFDEYPFNQGNEHLTPLYNSIVNKKALNITYHPFYEQNDVEYCFHPYYLKQYNGRWFCLGREESSQKIFNFALDRIVSIEFASTPYIRNEEIDFHEYFEDIIGVSRFENLELENIVLHFTSEQLQYVKTKPLHGSQKLLAENTDGGDISIEVIPNFELEQLIMSFGERVIVESPDWLRNKIETRIRDCINNYQ